MTRRWFVIAGSVSALTVALEVRFRHHGHPVFWWHEVPAFDLFFGVVGCLGLIVVAKWLGHTWLERQEDYYGNDAP
jgi:hypothetical protein